MRGSRGSSRGKSSSRSRSKERRKNRPRRGDRGDDSDASNGDEEGVALGWYEGEGARLSVPLRGPREARVTAVVAAAAKECIRRGARRQLQFRRARIVARGRRRFLAQQWLSTTATRWWAALVLQRAWLNCKSRYNRAVRKAVARQTDAAVAMLLDVRGFLSRFIDSRRAGSSGGASRELVGMSRLLDGSWESQASKDRQRTERKQTQQRRLRLLEAAGVAGDGAQTQEEDKFQEEQHDAERERIRFLRKYGHDDSDEDDDHYPCSDESLKGTERTDASSAHAVGAAPVKGPEQEQSATGQKAAGYFGATELTPAVLLSAALMPSMDPLLQSNDTSFPSPSSPPPSSLSRAVDASVRRYPAFRCGAASDLHRGVSE